MSDGAPLDETLLGAGADRVDVSGRPVVEVEGAEEPGVAAAVLSVLLTANDELPNVDAGLVSAPEEPRDSDGLGKPLAEADGAPEEGVVSGPVVGRGPSSVQVSGAVVVGNVPDLAGPVVAYVKLGTYEPVVLGVPEPVPTVPPEMGLVPEIEMVPATREDDGAAGCVVGLEPLSGAVDSSVLGVPVSGFVVIAVEALSLIGEEPDGYDVGNEVGVDKEDSGRPVGLVASVVPVPLFDIMLLEAVAGAVFVVVGVVDLVESGPALELV